MDKYSHWFAKILLLFTLLFQFGCTAQLPAISTGLLLADYKQTLYIAEHPDTFHEVNPILGRHPSENAVSLYFGTVIVGNLLLCEALPDKYIPWVQVPLIIVEAVVVRHNMSIGVKF